MQHELLFEIGTEELPAGYIMPALEQLRTLMAGKLAQLGLSHGEIRAAATPRRLALQVSLLAARQPDRREEILGPPRQAAYDRDNNPTKAAEGFAKSRGVSLAELQIVATPKGEYLMVPHEQKGEATATLLPQLLPELVKELSFPKSMHWGDTRTTFARPIAWIVALYAGELVPCQIDGVPPSSNFSRGHRFMAPQPFPVTTFAHYLEELRARQVLALPEERKAAVRAEIERAAAEIGGQVCSDEELVETVTNLVESPHAILGTFDRRYLALPKEAMITSMREHQKCFAVMDQAGNLLPNFIAVNNTKVKDKKLAAEGHQRVLRARLEDGLFFFNEDRQKMLAERIPGLSGIIFQAKLGTLLEKSQRITRLAELLALELAPGQVATVKRAAQLAKADLLSAMVNEFPSLQGIMGRHYALLDGEEEAVASAIQEHYMPLRAGSPLPVTLAGALVSIADRLDTMAGCFGIGQTPTGATDPFGLRRLTLGLLHCLAAHQLPFSLSRWIKVALELYAGKLNADPGAAGEKLLEFVKGRYVNDQIAKGRAAEAVEAVTSVAFDDVVDCSLRIEALLAINRQPAFALLAGSFKRLINIIKEHQEETVNESLLREEGEKNLYLAYRAVAAEAQPHLAGKRYEEALHSILKMKEPVDLFFEQVMVMAEEEEIRHNRLTLLTAIAKLFLKVGDFSKMYAISS